MGKKEATGKKENFEALLQKLEGLVARLEGGQLSLEESLQAFEEGMKLAQTSEKLLTEAQQRIEILVKDREGRTKAVPFAEEAEEKDDSNND